MCRLSRNLGASTSWNPKGLSRPVTGLLYLSDTRNSGLCFAPCVHTRTYYLYKQTYMLQSGSVNWSATVALHGQDVWGYVAGYMILLTISYCHWLRGTQRDYELHASEWHNKPYKYVAVSKSYKCRWSIPVVSKAATCFGHHQAEYKENKKKGLLLQCM
jgi:hypothetical protein